MKASLQERCTTQVRNEEMLRKSRKLEYEEIMKLGAMMYRNANREVDPVRLQECKELLKAKTGFLSNFRGHMEFLIRIKMALADDPAAFLDGVMAVYERLKSGRKLPGESLVMAAATIYENCPADMLDEVVDETREAYAKIKERHRFITSESDMALVALMIMSGKDPEQAAEQAEELYRALKDNYRINSEAAQAAAMVLALSEKAPEVKIRDFIGLYEACKAAGHATYKDVSMAIYAIFADLDMDRAEVVGEIGEVDVWLKGHKGYGTFGTGASTRRLFAASFVLEDHQTAESAAAIGVSRAVTQAIVEELLLILVTIILCCIIISLSTSSSSSS